LGKNAKQALQLLVIVLSFTALGAWAATVGNPAVIWTLRLAAPAAAGYLVSVLVIASRRPGKLPDYLHQVAPKYFERDGVCMAPVFETADGKAVLRVYFQNRYANHAHVRFAMRPPRRSFWFTRHNLPHVSVGFECPGGAFGMMRLRFPVPAKCQGRTLSFEVGADVKYPARKGELLRYREGRHLPAIDRMGGSDAGLALLLGWLGIFLAIASKGVGRANLALPTDLEPPGPDTLPEAGQPVGQILALPEPAPAAPAVPQRLAA
jgi:hypothetical protein